MQGPGSVRVVLQFENQAQPFIQGALQARGQRVGSLKKLRSRVTSCETFTTESRGRPVERAGNRTLPGTSASSKSLVTTATIAV